MSAFVHDRALALLVREVLCEQAYRHRNEIDVNREGVGHICRQLALRVVPLERVVPHVQLSLLELPKEELRAYAARVLDAISGESPTYVAIDERGPLGSIGVTYRRDRIEEHEKLTIWLGDALYPVGSVVVPVGTPIIDALELSLAGNGARRIP